MVETKESHEYQDYELTVEDRSSIKDIEKRIRDGRVTNEKDCRDFLDFLEGVEARVQEAMSIERSIGRTNLTLKHDHEKIHGIMAKLKAELDRLDQG